MTSPSPPERSESTTPGSGGLTPFGFAALLATAAATAAIATAWCSDRPGWPQSVGFAVAICLPGSLLAWAVARMPSADPARAVAASLAAILLRLVPPLVGLAWLSTEPRTTSTSERGGLLVVFYLALLATDIVLHMMGNRLRSRRPSRRPAAPD
jgi:hypothetical protein